MLIQAADGRMRVDENSFYLTDPNPPHRFWKAANPDDNGLIGVTDGAAIILTGCASGWVHLRVELHDGRPDVDQSHWDEIMELSYPALTDKSRVGAWNGGEDEFPVISYRGPGSYRLRIHVRGREEDRDAVAFEPVESYLLQAWPAPPATAITYKADLL